SSILFPSTSLFRSLALICIACRYIITLLTCTFTKYIHISVLVFAQGVTCIMSDETVQSLQTVFFILVAYIVFHFGCRRTVSRRVDVRIGMLKSDFLIK